MKLSWKKIVVVTLATAVCWAGAVSGNDAVDLESFSLEELLNVEIISVSKKSESAVKAPAAVYVITAEDIQHSGATCVPEALRLAPGVHAAQIDATRWALTIRGFNSRFANKLQVFVDGRSIYSPMFSGTYWEAGEVDLEDIEQIEVIRGPGATLWGANAVNGVINIITRKADDSSLEADAWASGNGLYRTRVSLSEKTGQNGALRLGVSGTKRGSTSSTTGVDVSDESEEILVSGRWDQSFGDHSHLFVSGSVLNLDQGFSSFSVGPTPPYILTGTEVIDLNISSINAKWSHDLSSDSSIEFTASRTWFLREEYLMTDRHEVSDLNFQHNLTPADRHELIWGAGYRHYHDDMQGRLGFGFDPASQTDWTLHAFVQDEFMAVRDRLELTVGVKAENRNYIDTQWQPSGRFAWTPHEQHTVWGSASKAVRVPSRSDRHLFIDMTALPPGATPMNPDNLVMLSLVGSEDVTPERLTAYEMGYRLQPTDHLLLDLAVFHQDYDNLVNAQAGDIRIHPVHGFPVMQMPLYKSNGSGATTQGGELAATLAGEHARVRVNYSYITFEEDSSVTSMTPGTQQLDGPNHQYSVHLGLSPLDKLKVDLLYRHLDEFIVSEVRIPAQDEVDLRIGWNPTDNWHLSIGGRNLLHENHMEFYDESGTTYQSLIERTFVATLKWRH